MGIVKNGTLGIGRKSFGDATYRTSRGRTIAAKRIQENKSNTSMQSDQRKAFGIMGRSAKLLSEWIDKTFDKTKYGSQRNHYVKLNAPIMEWLKVNKKLDGLNYLSQIVAAIEDGVTVYAGMGANLAESEFVQNEKELSASVTYSKLFAVGDKVLIVVAQSYGKTTPGNNGLSLSSSFAAAPIYEYVITDADAGKNTISLDKDKVPGLATACEPLSTYKQSAIMASVAVISGKDACQCYFSSLELYVEPGGGDRPEIE
ncbi:hypothetical protein H8S77_26345 [Parabacteroides sp. BX2]|jgi:hypothetical protein|uniref:Uncharacterized protein n=1 Tax=Parabacteroides segnis TaxID=2763058 RepID=A0ABR7E9Q9_9BACT|nr:MULTISPECIES: hypothetical protein [Parabacteroides]MBC5646388.1 hypothetical protein [Parabacteroides segnis]MCM0714147.1 hypothetical protein [Parabacteroides sp. TA-V-105]